MNSFQSDRNNSPYNTNRSDRNRHPEHREGMRFDDYGSPARGGYGNEGRMGTFGNQGNEMGGSRNRGNDNTYSSSYNYGTKDRYGTSESGFPSHSRQEQRMRHSFESGMGPMGGIPDNLPTRSHGYESDFDSHGGSSRVRDINYKRDTGKFKGKFDHDQEWYSSENPTYSEGHYMGSSYNRNIRPDEFGSKDGNYGSSSAYSFERYNSPDYRNRGYHENYSSNSRFDRDLDINDYDRY